MFCPKCGSQNTDETKYCRGCGAELSNVLAVVDGKRPTGLALFEKQIDLNSRAIRGIMLGIGFSIISSVIYSIPPQGGFFWLVPLIFAIVFLSGGVSRFIQARGIKALIQKDDRAALPPAKTEFMSPPRSIYETDDLDRQPASITERTTTHLEMDSHRDIK